MRSDGCYPERTSESVRTTTHTLSAVAVVQVRLRTLSPRWMLATSPWLRVNGEPPVRLTKKPVEVTVEPGDVVVEVALSRLGVDVGDTWLNPVTRYEGVVSEEVPLRLWFHPAIASSATRRGRLHRE